MANVRASIPPDIQVNRSEGIWLTVQTPNGFKVSVGRSEPAEAIKDLRALLGDAKVDSLLASMGGQVDNPNAGPFQQTPAESPPVQPTPDGDLQEFETCKCGQLKNRWVAPGISKAGKQFRGFWGCADKSCRLR